MLKIYNAYSKHGEIQLDDYIDFDYGEFDTGHQGFGQVQSGNLNCKRANYELQNLRGYLDYLRNIKAEDGYVKNFVMYNPVSYEMLEEKYKDIPKDITTYEQFGLNEEGILLFTNYIRLEYSNNDLVQRIFGRYPENGMYLLKPNASIDMLVYPYRSVQEHYEVLQSENLGRQLILAKMNRKI